MTDKEEFMTYDLAYLKNNNVILEIMQWLGMAITLIILVVAKFVPGLSEYARFVVPLNYFAVARMDYLIHRNGAKLLALEDELGYKGNEWMQGAVRSKIAVFDTPLFIGIALLGHVLSLDWWFSALSLLYWGLCAVTAIFVWLATKWGKGHYDNYYGTLITRK